MTEFLLYLYAESPVHAGAADSIDVLNLPIQREVCTGYPVIWGQSLKGALRQAAVDSAWSEPEVTEVFGSAIGSSDADGGGTTAGTLAIGDAALIAMPVPTLRRTFAWTSTELMLGRLARRYATLGVAAPECPQDVPTDAGRSAIATWATPAGEVLGPCVVPMDVDTAVAEWAALLARDALGGSPAFRPFAAKIVEDFLVVGSDVAPVLLRECTEQSVRIQLKETEKTVANGPFYSEYLPAESILAAALMLRGRGDTESHRENLRSLCDGTLLQVGGDETLGKGLVWARLLEGPQ